MEALINFQTLCADLTGMESPTPRCWTKPPPPPKR